MTLDQIIDLVDLPAYISGEFPSAGARPGQAGSMRAVWRDEKSGSFSVHQVGGRWLWKDYATGEGGNIWTFLTKVMGLTPEAAGAELERLTGEQLQAAPRSSQIRQRIPWSPKASAARPVGQARTSKHLNSVSRLEKVPAAAAAKGLTLADCLRYGISGNKAGDMTFPIFGPDGEVLSYKKRLYEKRDGQRYVYALAGHGSPAWCNQNIRDKDPIIVIEGELNALTLDIALGDQYGIMGVAGKNGHIHLDFLDGKTVYVYSDKDDQAGKNRKRWARAALWAGAAQTLELAPQEKDAADHHAGMGAGHVAQVYQELIRDATPLDLDVDAEEETRIQVASSGIQLEFEGYSYKGVQLTNWQFEPWLRLRHPDGSASERGDLRVNGQSHTLDIPAGAWASLPDLNGLIGPYGAVWLAPGGANVGRVRQYLLTHYSDLEEAQPVPTYGLHKTGEAYVELYEDKYLGPHKHPPVWYAGPGVEPGAHTHAAPAVRTETEIQAAMRAITLLPHLVQPHTALAMIGYAAASVYAPRLIPRLGGKLPFLYVAGERESGKSSAAEAVLAMATGRKSRLYKASSMTPYQYDLAAMNHNNLLMILDEFRPGCLDDAQIRKHYDLGVRWRGTGRLEHNLAYHLNAPMIIMGEGFTDDPAALSRGALYFTEKETRGSTEAYNAFLQHDLAPYATHLHQRARNETDGQVGARMTQVKGWLETIQETKINPRLEYALLFIMYGLALTAEDIRQDWLDPAAIQHVAKIGIITTLAGGEETLTNFERWIEQLGTVISEARDPSYLIAPAAKRGEIIIFISGAVDAIKKRYKQDAAISSSRMVRKYAKGCKGVEDAEKETHRCVDGTRRRGLKVNVRNLSFLVDFSQIEHFLQSTGQFD